MALGGHGVPIIQLNGHGVPIKLYSIKQTWATGCSWLIQQSGGTFAFNGKTIEVFQLLHSFTQVIIETDSKALNTTPKKRTTKINCSLQKICSPGGEARMGHCHSVCCRL